MKMELPYDKDKVNEFARYNPRIMARRIMKANADDMSTHQLINQLRDYMFGTGSFESLNQFNNELARLGWGKE